MVAVPARVPSWTGAASGAARALVEAAVEVMATAPVRARGSTAAASGAAPAPARGPRLLARGRGTIVALPASLTAAVDVLAHHAIATVASQIGHRAQPSSSPPLSRHME